jgi:hypothetical protein
VGSKHAGGIEPRLKGVFSLRSTRNVSIGVFAVALSACLALAVPGIANAIHNQPVGAGQLGVKNAANAAVLRSAPHSSWSNAKCFGLIPFSGDNSYRQNCYGHDEPAIDPISSVPGTGQDITWTIRLPRSSEDRPLLDMGPTFWVGATLSDPSSLANSVFSELQFYPDSSLLPQTGNNINTACTSLGFNVNPHPGTWSICDFTWGLYNTTSGFAETAAYVSVVDKSTNPNAPLYLHSGDRIKVHIFNSGDANNDAEQVITDLTTGQSGSLIMDSTATTGAGSAANPGVGDGPLTLPDSTNTTSNAMPWGVVDGTPFAFSWEIGHSNFYTHPTQGECVPGQWDCFSYDTTHGWGAITPLQIQSVTFKVGSSTITPSSWATNDSQGGVAEDTLWCGSYNTDGTNKCNFPWYTYHPDSHAILFGTTYPETPPKYTYGQSPAEYANTATCPGPLTGTFGFLYYCDTTLSPIPPIP